MRVNLRSLLRRDGFSVGHGFRRKGLKYELSRHILHQLSSKSDAAGQ